MFRKAKLALEQGGAAQHPVRFVARLAAWRLLTIAGRSATVKSPRYGVTFWCPPEWRGSAKLTYALRDEYEPELAHLARWVKPGDLVVDVGAHYGAYSLPLARLVGDEGLVLAVEPSSHARGVLARNLEINDFHNVQVLPLALGEQAATGVLRVHADRSRASLALAAEDAVGTEDVQVARLDDVVPAGRSVAFMKVDVEGHELLALRGATAVLERDRPVVIFEQLSTLAVKAGLPARGAWDLLAERGYRMHAVTGDGELLPVMEPTDSVAQANVIAIHPG